MVPDDTVVFKSSLHPIKVTFKDTKGRKYSMMFKTGDDLRQDQLVIQIITLMDQLLQKENLDLKLSPYKILATSTSAGLTQFVPSVSFRASRRASRPTRRWPTCSRTTRTRTRRSACARRRSTPSSSRAPATASSPTSSRRRPPPRQPAAGARRPLLPRRLRLHPRPRPQAFAPAMKLSKEMVDAMGGSSSDHYRQFKQYCFLAYTALRKSSNLILNLFSLMVDANIPDIKLEPDKAVLKVKERFHLELNEEDASATSSVSSTTT